MSLTLGHFEQVMGLRDAAGKPYLLIGGQAVNFWAETYLKVEPELERWLPFTSVDIDFYGNRDDVNHLAGLLGLTAYFPPGVGATALAGLVPIKLGETKTCIEFVRLVPGLGKNKIEGWAIVARRGQKEIRVLDPVSLLASKANMAVTLDQKQRRDAAHLRMLMICTRAFLRETLRGVEAGELPARGWLGAVGRVLKLAESASGKKASRKFEVDWQQALPLPEIAASRQRLVSQFRSQRLPQWLQKQCAR